MQNNHPCHHCTTPTIPVGLSGSARNWAFRLFVIALFNLIFALAYVVGKLEIAPTQLTLRSEGCQFTRQLGITTTADAGRGNCKATAPFRPNLVGSGGRIYLDDMPIAIADHQIVATAALKERSLSYSQKIWLGWLVACMGFFVGATLWVSYLYRREEQQ